MHAQIKNHYIQERVLQVDVDFLSFEEDLITEQDSQLVLNALANNVTFKANPHNSIILYVTGLTDCFDFSRERADTIGGTPPDIDIDFEALGREDAVNWVINEWGRTHVANIMTQGTFKPKSLTRRYFKITGGNDDTMREILRAIPPPVFGKEANLEKILKASPKLKKEAKFKPWLYFAENLEGMVANFGIHPAGVIISDFPIPETIPCWKNSKSEFITQYDMVECEELGSIKFDFLVINNLDILKECVRLVSENHNKFYDIDNIPDFDKKAYALMAQGLLTGIFQMETSGTAKKLIQKITPSNWEEISDVSALNRPGPMSAGLDSQYIENKNNGYAPADMPAPIAEILKGTYWTLVYQEQVMQLCQLAGFTMREADDVRRAMGKKKHDVLGSYKIQFVEGMVKTGVSQEYADDLWVTLAGDPDDPNNNGFADYCFNKSHSVN